jgi:hypothetical protein
MTHAPPATYDIEDEYDDIAMSISFRSIAFTSIASPLTDFSNYLVVNYACSINLTIFKFLSLTSRTFTRPLDIAHSAVSMLPYMAMGLLVSLSA